MSYDAYPACTNCVSQDFIKKQIPTIFKGFLDALSEFDLILDEFAQYKAEDRDIGEFNTEITDKQLEDLDNWWKKVKTEFKNTTGLELDIFYFNPDEGNAGDDIEYGVIFEVGGVYELTESGKRFKGEIQHKRWVNFG